MEIGETSTECNNTKFSITLSALVLKKRQQGCDKHLFFILFNLLASPPQMEKWQKRHKGTSYQENNFLAKAQNHILLFHNNHEILL